VVALAAMLKAIQVREDVAAAREKTIDFEKSIVWIIWIGTHRDYDKIDVKEVRHGGA
jgi:mRNA-degrading endonuclease HigB of HigAB toxin-antitoxin module